MYEVETFVMKTQLSQHRAIKTFIVATMHVNSLNFNFLPEVLPNNESENKT